jgi:hypothetical protein
MIQRISTIVGWLGLAFIVYVTLSPIEYRPVVAIILGSAFGLEALQLLTPDRHARVIDALVKAAGGICGIGFGQLRQLFLRAQTNRAD